MKWNYSAICATQNGAVQMEPLLQLVQKLQAIAVSMSQSCRGVSGDDATLASQIEQAKSGVAALHSALKGLEEELESNNAYAGASSASLQVRRYHISDKLSINHLILGSLLIGGIGRADGGAKCAGD